MRARYLLHFSYLGTGFRGSEKRWQSLPDPQSVQGVLELGLHKLKSLNYPSVHLSSRTDGGVHALASTAHVDLERSGSSVYTPELIAFKLNKYFSRNDITVQVNNIQRVPDHFSARFNALSRTYMYRIATLKKDVEVPDRQSYALQPIEEWKRCYYIKEPNFDMQKLVQGASYFPGYHDFSSFKKFDKDDDRKHSRRTLYSVEIRPSRAAVTTATTQARSEIFDYWDVLFRGRGFVHNQIRRIVGLLRAVALNKVPLEEIQVMLQVPSKHSWPSRAITAPAYGLYLCNVEYDPRDLMHVGNEAVKERVREDSDDED